MKTLVILGGGVVIVGLIQAWVGVLVAVVVAEAIKARVKAVLR